MQVIVIYDTKFGNTAKIAQAIARGAGALGSVVVMDTDQAARQPTEHPDLLLIGGPTQRRAISPGLRDFIAALPPSLQGVPSVTFDTRYRGATLIMGSAASDAAKQLRNGGGRIIAAPASFFVERRGPIERQGLEQGELERAQEWGWAVSSTALNGGTRS